MDDREIQRLCAEEQTYWWHVSRRAILESVLNRFCSTIRHPELASALRSSAVEQSEGWDSGSPAQKNKIPDPDYAKATTGRQVRNDGEGWSGRTNYRILDVGCGTGENFYWLSKFGEVTGADTSELAVELASQKGTAVLGRAEDLPFEDNTFNLITAFDILEHVTDEERVLGEWGRVLRPQGLLFVSVPAYQWLFGPHDRALEHLRRYNLSGLKKILHDNGFHIIFNSYFFCLTFPAFLAQRWLVKFSQNDTSQYVGVAPWLNNLLVALGKTEAAWLKFGQFLFGSSIVILARKIDQPRNI